MPGPPHLPNMSEAPAKVQNNGRISIPVEIRRKHGLQQGDYVLVDVEPLEGAETDG